MKYETGLPELDCHAHIAPDVTFPEVQALGYTHVLAMTRSLAEARYVANRSDSTMTWGVGVHPARPDSLEQYDPSAFRGLAAGCAVVGEVGLDRRGSRADQERVFDDVLAACSELPVLVSIHSAGRTREVVDRLEEYRTPGAILHWFLGTDAERDRAIRLGAFFSINTAMSDELISALPVDRVLPETDFPAKKVQAKRPGCTEPLEIRLSSTWEMSHAQVRHQLWSNLRSISHSSGAIESLPEPVADLILSV